MTPSIHEAKRPKKPQSDKANKIQRKRAIEKNFSQDQQAAQKKLKFSDFDSDEETTSDIDFEVGGTIKSSWLYINFFTT